MHILFLTDNFPPEVNAPASRTFEHCREWVRRGHKVTVITGAPNFPKGELFAGYRNAWRARETMDGIEVVRVWTYITANEGFVKRTLDYVSFMASAIPAGLGIRDVDIIVATSPQLFTPCAAYVVSRLKRRPYVFELRDLWPESIRAVGAMRNARILDLLERLELFLYAKSGHVVSVTDAFKRNLISRGIDGGKISVRTNGADLSRFAPAGRDLALAEQTGLQSKLVVGYVGTHGMAHALDTVLAAAGRLQAMPQAQTGHIHFMLLGDGAEKARLKEIAASQSLRNVTFLDSVPRQDVVRYWSLVDLAVIHLRRTPLFETVVPSKLFECMAMGIPVLHGVLGESAEIVQREGCGLLFEPENPEALVESVLRLARDPEGRKVMSERGRGAAQRYDRRTLAGEMLEDLRQVCAAQPRASPDRETPGNMAR